MKKLTGFLLMVLMVLFVFACSAPMPGEDVGEVESVGETHQAVVTPCSITGMTGSSTFNTTVVTGVRIAPIGGGTKMIVTACKLADSTCTSSTHTFSDVHWTDVNGVVWAGSIDFPLRRIKTEAPGCQLSDPSKWCMTLRGDNDVGDHVNLLQNVNRFLSDRPITIDTIEAPVGGAVAQFYGTGWNSWRTKYTNAAGTGLDTKYWDFAMTDCQ